MSIRFKSLVSLLVLSLPVLSLGLSFPLPSNGDNVIGQVQTAVINPGQDPHDVGRQYDIGYDALMTANPNLSPNGVKKATKIIIPSLFILPPGPQQGIIINIAEKRLYYFPANQNIVYTFPIGVGLIGWSTPTGNTFVVEKIKNPIWTVPESIYEKLAGQGIYVPKQILPGPDDPLGYFALRLDIPGYLIHGTNEPTSIGTRASSGCIRMFPEDIQALFTMVPAKTPVHIVDAPYKAGWLNGQLYLEAHQPLTDALPTDQATTTSNTVQTNPAISQPVTADTQTLVNQANQPLNNGSTAATATTASVPTSTYLSLNTVVSNALGQQAAKINWQLVNLIGTQQNGIPQVIAIGLGQNQAPVNNTQNAAASGAAQNNQANNSLPPVIQVPGNNNSVTETNVNQ